MCVVHMHAYFILKIPKQNQDVVNRHTLIQTHYGNELGGSTRKLVSFDQISQGSWNIFNANQIA